MVYFINGKAHWSLWLDKSVSMRQRGEKRKKSRHLPKGYMCQMGNENMFRERVRRNNRVVNAILLLRGKFLSGKNLFNGHFHILEGQVKENTNPFQKVAAVLFSYYCFVGIYYIILKDDLY